MSVDLANQDIEPSPVAWYDVLEEDCLPVAVKRPRKRRPADDGLREAARRPQPDTEDDFNALIQQADGEYANRYTREPPGERYVYAQRGPLENSAVKVGSHTGSLKKLFSRYVTYSGDGQEFKVVKVEPTMARLLERDFHKKLTDEGLHESHELFEPKAWDRFDDLAISLINGQVTIQYMARFGGNLEITDLPNRKQECHTLSVHHLHELITLLESDHTEEALSLLRTLTNAVDQSE